MVLKVSPVMGGDGERRDGCGESAREEIVVSICVVTRRSTGAALLSDHWLDCLDVIVSKIEAQPCQARRSAVAQQETPETRHALDSEIATDARSRDASSACRSLRHHPRGRVSLMTAAIRPPKTA